MQETVFAIFLYGKNNFVERSKILLDTDLKIILLNHQNNFVGTLKIMSNVAKNFDSLATGTIIIILISSIKLLF